MNVVWQQEDGDFPVETNYAIQRAVRLAVRLTEAAHHMTIKNIFEKLCEWQLAIIFFKQSKAVRSLSFYVDTARACN